MTIFLPSVALADVPEATFRADVNCVARLLDLPAPAELPHIRIVNREELTKITPKGWDKEAWARRAGGLFIGLGKGAIQLYTGGRRLEHTAYPHEITHFVLWANNKAWQHNNWNVDRQIGFVMRKFRSQCR